MKRYSAYAGEYVGQYENARRAELDPYDALEAVADDHGVLDALMRVAWKMAVLPDGLWDEEVRAFVEAVEESQPEEKADV